ncbi:MAG: hypothetical protein HDT35_06785 [Clostridiales bacterium]|nr:hypothetical protein [Clostridiales bacterium]
MSVQESKLKDIADAIREKDGTTEPIPANDFPERIRAIQGGGGIELESISIISPPAKTAYLVGERFDPAGMEIQAVYSNGAVATATGWLCTPSGELTEEDTKITVRYTEQGVTKTAEVAIEVKSSLVSIYGVEWDWTDSGPTRGVRTDAAAEFSDPVPAVNNGTGSSPFDGLMPWAGMVKETRAGGVMVKEPKYWFKWTKTGKKLKLQIADGPVEGFHVDPVNMDRGDGLGELDFSYIARYHCASGTYKSETNKAPQKGIPRSAARTSIHNLGANIWQMDFAQMWYIGMLYLVEFADWDGQATIGYGCSASGFQENNGKTDVMQYHTGTTAATRNASGFIQYRNIEGWWDNVFDWMDGCYCRNNSLYVIENPNQFNDNDDGTLVGSPTDGYPSDFTIPTTSGLEWALFPSANAGSTTTYVPDNWRYNGGYPCLYHGSDYTPSPGHGPFCVYYASINDAGARIGCRLQERPPKAE